MLHDRYNLEQRALKTVSAELYYDLADNINQCTNTELLYIIRCNGDSDKEQMYESYIDDLYANDKEAMQEQ